MRSLISAVVLCALAGLVVGAAGCQFSGSSRDRSTTQRNSTGEDVAQLTPKKASDARISLARSLEQRGETDRALEAYREILEKDPKQSTACWRLAVLLDRRGNTQESEGFYRRALKAEPKNVDLHCDYGYSLYLKRRWAESEDHLRQALALKPAHRRAHNNLGMLLAQIERYDESLREFRKSGCPEAEAHANMAFVLTLNRRWDDARHQYELALSANPESAAAKAGLAKLDQIIAQSRTHAGPVALVGHEQLADPQRPNSLSARPPVKSATDAAK